MTLAIDEREYIEELVKPDEVTVENVSQFLEEDVYLLLKRKNNLNTIRDRVIFFNANKFRPYDSVLITKFLQPDYNCLELFDELFGCLTPPFITFIDFHFLFECKSVEENPGLGDVLKFQTASKASAINDTIKIVTKKDYNDLLEEFKNKTHADLLNDVYRHHVDLYEYQNSGLRPYQLLSLVVHISKFPKV